MIRRALASDAADILALYRQLVNNPALDVQAARLAQLAQDPDHWLLVATRDARVCGSVLLIFCKDVMFGEQPFAVLENLVVDSQLRGQGVGRALLEHAEALCLSRSASKLMITSGRQREGAHGFFEALGYCGQTKKSFIKYHRSFQI